MKKEIPIKFEDKNYLCKLESTDSNLINIELSQDLILKFPIDYFYKRYF